MNHTLMFDEWYEALCRRDAGYVGSFWAAIRTTGIFCLPICSARKPKRENVEFFTTAKAALLAGYRPCKVCHPMRLPGEMPSYVEELLKELRAEPTLRLKDHDLRARGIEPAAVRRWFKRHHQMTFHTYQRMLRLNRAYRELSAGKQVTAAAFDAGYESLSGFGEGFRTTFETTPSRGAAKRVIHLSRFTTPLGPMFGCATERGVCLCEFTDRRMLEREFADLRRRLSAVLLPTEDHPHSRQLERELEEYFSGDRREFDVPLDTPTTPFRQRVWDELRTIPYGETRSYAEQAQRIGQPTAIRAVASANGQNRVAIIIPCHRVIGSDGSLTGYAGGLARKQWLLDLEKRG